MSAEPPPACRLQQVPAELRNRIYEDCLVEDDTICITWKGKGKSNPRSKLVPRITEPALLRTSSEVCRETMPIFYGQNIFKPGDRKLEVKDWFATLSNDKLKLIKCVVVCAILRFGGQWPLTVRLTDALDSGRGFVKLENLLFLRQDGDSDRLADGNAIIAWYEEGKRK